MNEILTLINKIQNRNNQINTIKSQIKINFVINKIKCTTGYNCLNNYELQTIIGTGTFGTVYNVCQKKNCDYVVKLQDITEKSNKDIFDMEIKVMQELMNKKYDGVDLLYHTICDGECDNKKQIKIGLMILDKWDGSLHGQDQIVRNSYDTFIDTISSQVKILHDLKYVHWDLLPKNVLYKIQHGKTYFTITDFGACQKEYLDPYSSEYYDKYYFDPNNYQSILTPTNLNINPTNIRTLTNNYKGIVDYFILYKYIKLKTPDSKTAKRIFIETLYLYDQKGKEVLKNILI